MNSYYKLKTLTGEVVNVDESELFEALKCSGFKVYGMPLDCLARFLYHYHLRRGKMPVSVEEIDRVFGEEQLWKVR